MKAVILFVVSLIITFYLGYMCNPGIRFDDVANRKYTDNYKCLQFSQDLVQKLKERGIQSEVVIGYQPDGTKHAWIQVWIEPQTGQPTVGYSKEK